jgi:endonuclease-3
MAHQISAKIKLVNELLIQKYGIPSRAKKPPEILDLLIATILSQNTNDKNSYKAFKNLKDKYPTWQTVAKLDASTIENIIRVAGLGKQKSKAIKSLLNTLIKERNELSLDYIKKFDNEKALNELTKFDGIGIKTASCVLLFSLRKNVCPVDTHVHRTTNRIGIVKTTTPNKTFEIINKNIPHGIAHQFHTNLIRLGREICKPAKPSCSICPLLDICNYKKKYFDKTNLYQENKFLLLDSIK